MTTCSRDGMVRMPFTGCARAGQAANGHRLQADQAERLVTAVGEHGVGAAKQRAPTVRIEM